MAVMAAVDVDLDGTAAVREHLEAFASEVLAEAVNRGADANDGLYLRGSGFPQGRKALAGGKAPVLPDAGQDRQLPDRGQSARGRRQGDGALGLGALPAEEWCSDAERRAAGPPGASGCSYTRASLPGRRPQARGRVGLRSSALTPDRSVLPAGLFVAALPGSSRNPWAPPRASRLDVPPAHSSPLSPGSDSAATFDPGPKSQTPDVCESPTVAGPRCCARPFARAWSPKPLACVAESGGFS